MRGGGAWCALALVACGGASYGDASSAGPADASPEASTPITIVVEAGANDLDAGRDAGDAEAIDAGPRKRIFITTSSSTGNLGGLGGADALCNKAAHAATLDGEFVAWLTTSGKNAIDRVTGSGPWYDARGVDLIFTGKTTGSNPLNGIAPATPITRNENGQVFTPAVDIWTGTAVGGIPPTPAYCQGSASCACGGWTLGAPGDLGFYARSGEKGQNWPGAANINCSDVAHLLCIEN